MAYTPIEWLNDQAPAINQSNLNYMEQGILDAHELSNNLQNQVDETVKEVRSKNLFNKNAEHISDSIIVVTSADGSLTSNSDYDVYYIPIENGKTYSFEPAYQQTGSTYAKVACLYKLVDGVYTFSSKNTSGSYNSTTHVTTITITDANAEFLGLTVKKTRNSDVMVVEGATYPTTYIPYFTPYKEIKENLVRADSVDNSAVLKVSNYFINTSEINLYNPNDPDIETGKIIDGYGTMQAADYAQVSGYIPIEPNVEYVYPVYESKTGTSVALTCPIYDKNKTYIGRANPSGTTYKTTYDSTTKLLSVITTDISATYIRVNVPYRTQKEMFYDIFHYYGNFMVTKAPFPDNFHAYGEVKEIKNDIFPNSSDLLYGKSALFYGDSICFGDSKDGYAGRIGLNNHMTWMNMGITGATFYKNNQVACIAERPIMLEHPDYIILEGGTNDADRIGDAIHSTPAAFGSYSYDNYGTDDANTYYGFDITTFCGAFEYTLKHMISECTGTKFGYIVAHKMGRNGQDFRPTANNRRKYFETAMDICNKWGVPVLNLWDGCYLNPYNIKMYDANMQTGEFYTDGQHLQPKGYDYITPIIEAWMKNL